MNSAIIVVTYIVVIAFDFIPVINDKNKKEIIIYSTVLGISFCILFLYSIGIIVPGPSNLVNAVIK